jgi:DNA-binding IclR family transcriptional regulator
MPSLTASPASFWDDVDHGILRAAQSPATCRQIADKVGLPLNVAKTQIEDLTRARQLVQLADDVRYQLTVVGYKRLFELADTHTRPGHKAAA